MTAPAGRRAPAGWPSRLHGPARAWAGVVAELAPGRWRIGLELVGPAPEQREAAPVPDHGIEGREQAQPLVEGMAARAGGLVGGAGPGGSGLWGTWPPLPGPPAPRLGPLGPG